VFSTFWNCYLLIGLNYSSTRTDDRPSTAGSPSGEAHRREKATYERLWSTSAYLIIAVASALRIYDLTLKPLHHDEGVNGFFLLDLFRHGVYRYNPANYHGPTLYYLSLLVCSINNLLFGGEGTTTRALRMLPVVFGIGTVALIFAVRRWLGTVATIIAAALLAFSPGAVYLSRDFIHETLLVFFTLAFVFYCLEFWRTHERRDLMMCAVAAALMITTKETAPITWLVLAVSTAVSLMLVRPARKPKIADFGGLKTVSVSVAVATVVFLICCVVLFSSFFGNFPQGLRDALSTYTYWTHTGMSQHPAPWFTHVRWLLQMELPILLLGAAGAIVALLKRNNRLAVFSAVWGLSLLAIYSALPYKTPWLMLNVIVPLAFSAGYAVQESWRGVEHYRFLHTAVAVVALLAVSASAYQSVRLNFFHYDDDRCVYPYAQTPRAFLKLVEEIDGSAERFQGKQTSIAVLSPDYWPLPWYVRDYSNAGFYGKVVPTTADLVIGSTVQDFMLKPTLAGYTYRGTYSLRPGVQLTLYIANHASH